ncbi:uncharacterized protein LOC131942735 [Physella acuta]|uniref:uncharacterized protein LOC131942735 n=1 Tax=Physella acuta TaxID=109671 RepID=UPI0027DB5839|nr:uncharacterized protein LOC131942735 [Physella acuta]XP_059158749.1 uncharacterized protein LOC131942735 [Physella acuta]XP_059158828.1 uncharacterized protein LOC131942735 [Physella acuta]XP_059158897.1 uncharacterized protein LOC131942735 [Physella acuta]XP_059158982.1 uncharacterized protein LOC131942735 [Physella acuta]
MELTVLIVCCVLATVSSITASTVTVSYATSTMSSTSSTMLQSNVTSSENTTQTTNTTSVNMTSPANTSEATNTTTQPSSSQSSTATTLNTTQTSSTISTTSEYSAQGSSSLVTTTPSPTTTLTQTSAIPSITSSPAPESTSISSPAPTATSTPVTTLAPTTSSTATTTVQTSIPTNILIPTTLPTTTTTTSQPTTTASVMSNILSMNVTAAASHYAYFECNSTLLNSFFACLCGTSYQCRIPLTFRQGSNYLYDPGEVEQSGQTSSNEIFICRIDDLNSLQRTYLNCSRGQTSCGNCGHFNFTSSQCSGRSTQVKWSVIQSVKLGYYSNIVNIVCDSSNVQCAQATPPPANSGTTTTSTVKSDALIQSGETGNTGLILGLVFGFLVLAVVVAMAIFWWKQRNDKMRGSTVFDDDSTPAQFTNGSTNDYVTSSTSSAKANNARPYVNIGVKDGRNGSGISGEYNAGYQEVELLAHPGTGNGKAPPHPQDPGLKTKPDLNFNQTDEPDGEDDSDSSWSDESEQEDDTEPNNEYSRLGNIAARQNLNDYGAANSPSSNYNLTATPTSGQQSRDLPHPPPQVIELSTPGVKLKNDYDYPTVSYPRESKIYNEVDDEEEGSAQRNSEVYTTINETQLPEPQSRGSNYNPYFELDIDSMCGSKSGT